MLLRSINSLEFGSITLEVSRPDNDPNNIRRLGIVNASFTQAVSKLQNMDKEIEDLRIRIVASYNKKTSQIMDYVTQRSNEYLTLEKNNRQFRINTPANDYIDYIRRDLRHHALAGSEDILSESQPFSPYSTDMAVIPNMFQQKSFSRSGVAPGTIYYDVPLINILPTDNNGQIIRRSVVNTNIGTLPNRTQIRMNEQGLWTEQSIQQESLSPTQNLEKVFLPPVQFDFSGLTEGNLEQLTFYMFIYDSKYVEDGQEFNLPKISLVTGMSFSRTANVIGNRTVWPRIAPQEGIPRIGRQLPGDSGEYQDTTSLEAPEISLFQRIDLNPQNVVIERVNSMFDRIYGRLARSILDDKPEIRKIIKKDNFFSDLWVTKDSDENNRFMFAFDLESCLIANSYFPFLYRSPNISNQLINKQGLMNNPNSDPSRVLRMNVSRRMVDRDSDIPINDLGTLGGKKMLGPDRTFRQKTIGDAIQVNNVYLNPDPSRTRSVANKTIFYEGKDSLNEENTNLYEVINSDVIYGVEYVVYDAAPIFMRNMIKFLLERKSTVTEIFDIIVNSVPTPEGYQGGSVLDGRNLYNPVSLTLNVPLSNIKATINGANGYFDALLLDSIRQYQQILDDLVPFEFESERINVAEYYENEFKRNEGLIDPLVIKDIEKLMDIGIQLIYRKLTEIFPNDPMGRGLDIAQTSNLQRRGFCQRKVPLISDEYYFDTVKTEGQSFGFGSDFVFTRESNLQGLSRISVDEYVNRINLEFEKYFQTANPAVSITPVGSYVNSSYGYLTANVVRTPGNDDFVQTIAGGQLNPVVRYNLNLYGQLFADIANLKYAIKNRQTNPAIIGMNQDQTENNYLYDSVLKALEEQHRVEINFDIQPQYRAPNITTGETPTTVGDDFSRSRSLVSIYRNGPLAIPTLIGGENNINPDIITYVEGVGDLLSKEDPSRSKGSVDKEREKKLQEERPIKLPFAILGELTVDKVLDFQTPYEEKEFNSLKEFINITNLTADSLVASLQNTFLSQLPNQIKSAIVVSATNQNLSFGEGDITFDACRPYLSDQDGGEEDHLISFSNNSPEEPPYFKTYDPTKIYAKFLTFWMNYKQIAVIEYLDSFGNLAYNTDFYSDISQLGEIDEGIFDRTKLPRWQRLSRAAIDDAIKDQKTLLCRVRMMSPFDYGRILDYKEPVMELLMKFFARKEELELPIYNSYFLMGVGEPPPPPFEPPPKEEPPATFEGIVGPGFTGENEK